MDSSGWTTQRQHDVGQEQLKNPTQQTMCETFMDTSRKSGKHVRSLEVHKIWKICILLVSYKAGKEDYKTAFPALLSDSSLVER